MLTHQRLELCFEARLQAVQRREMHFFLELEVRFESAAEAAHGFLGLSGGHPLEGAACRRQQCVQEIVLCRQPPARMGQAQPQSRLVFAAGHRPSG